MVPQGGDICTRMADSLLLYSRNEPNIVSNYTPVENKTKTNEKEGHLIWK